MGTVIEKHKMYLTCVCSDGLISIEYSEWPCKDNYKLKEFDLVMHAPCGSNLWNRFKMAWKLFMQSDTHYLVIDDRDAQQLCKFMLDNMSNEVDKTDKEQS